MPHYVDGFVMVVKKKDLPAYRALATKASKWWKKNGALEYVECVGDDMKSKWAIPFPKLIKARKNELVIFSFIVYRSKKERDRANARVMKEPSMMPKEGERMPFDMKRMAYGGFKVLVEA